MSNLFADDFLLYRTFGCGVDQKVFNKKYLRLSDPEQERIQRVAIRSWMIIQLRYRFQYERNFSFRGQDWSRLAYKEKPSLEIYLLATCLDTLAGKPSNYKEFTEWLEEEITSEKISVNEVKEYFNCWRQEYGISQTLRNLFDDLPSVLTKWLSVHLQFEKYSGTSTLNRKLFKYIFNEWRHPFTHGSITPNVWGVNTDIELPTDENKWWSYSPDGYLMCRSGLDLATIIRVIIYSAVLNKLRFEIKAEHLDVYVGALSKLDAFYKFKWEMRHNVRMLQYWENYDGSKTILDQLPLNQVQRLNSKLQTSSINMEQSLLETLTEYEENVKTLNYRIMDFNEAYSRKPFDVPDAYCQALSDFFSQQVKTDAYKAVLKINQNNRVRSIDLFIREVFLYRTLDMRNKYEGG